MCVGNYFFPIKLIYFLPVKACREPNARFEWWWEGRQSCTSRRIRSMWHRHTRWLTHI